MDRSEQIVEVLVDAFADLIEADPRAFRRKFRRMAQDPFSFSRGSACLFYGYLGEATAKIHCVSDAGSEAELVDFQTE